MPNAGLEALLFQKILKNPLEYKRKQEMLHQGMFLRLNESEKSPRETLNPIKTRTKIGANKDKMLDSNIEEDNH